MDTKTLNPKAKYLLGAGLDVLHHESREWIETIDFWKDETRFFDKLLKQTNLIDKEKLEYGQMLKGLDTIHKDLFEDLKDAVINHEQFLSRLEKGEKGKSDSQYRDKHAHLKKRIETFTRDFKAFKNIIFDYVKSLDNKQIRIDTSKL